MIVYQVAVGARRPLWERCIESVAAYAERIGAEHIVQREPILRIAPVKSARSPSVTWLPILEKFNAWEMLDRYDEIAVIDADVYAKPDAESVFDFVQTGAVFSAAVERDMPITRAYAQKLDRYAQGQYGDPAARFRNMGVTVLHRGLLDYLGGQTIEQFIRRPEFERYINGEGLWRYSTEQTFLNEWLVRAHVPVGPLPWAFNALYGMLVNGAMDEAHLVHFLLSDHLNGDDPMELLRTGSGRVRV